MKNVHGFKVLSLQGYFKAITMLSSTISATAYRKNYLFAYSVGRCEHFTLLSVILSRTEHCSFSHYVSFHALRPNSKTMPLFLRLVLQICNSCEIWITQAKRGVLLFHFWLRIHTRVLNTRQEFTKHTLHFYIVPSHTSWPFQAAVKS